MGCSRWTGKMLKAPVINIDHAEMLSFQGFIVELSDIRIHSDTNKLQKYKELDGHFYIQTHLLDIIMLNNINIHRINGTM